MPATDITATSTVDLSTDTGEFQITSVTPDEAQDQNENFYDNNNFEIYLGYFQQIPEFRTAIQAFATWVLGKGWTAQDDKSKVELDFLRGWGEDSLGSILWNLLVMKKVMGDSFAEVIRNPDDGSVINLKPLGTLRIVTNKKGIIIRYEQRKKGKVKKYPPHKILHLVNDRIGEEIHGLSITESVQWVIDARKEAMEDKRKNLHRSTIRIIEVDEDDTSRLDNLKKDWKSGIKDGSVILVPKGTGKVQDFSPPTTEHLEWIRYLENFFYQALGVPKVILGGSEEFTESSSKIAYTTYEQVYTREVIDLEKDLWNQLGIKITFNKPASLINEVLTSESKNNAQTGFQPNDIQAGVGKDNPQIQPVGAQS